MTGPWQERLSAALNRFTPVEAQKLSDEIRQARIEGKKLTALELVLWERLTERIETGSKSV